MKLRTAVGKGHAGHAAARARGEDERCRAVTFRNTQELSQNNTKKAEDQIEKYTKVGRKGDGNG